MIDSFRRVAGCGRSSDSISCKREIKTGQGIYPESKKIIFLNQARCDEKHWQWEEF
jgi:hypothetical protein